MSISAGLPHDRVAVRLAPSAIAGIGVFAGMDIRQGTNVFPNDDREIRWIAKDELDRAQPSDFHRALYHDFAIRDGGRLGCPPSFDRLTVGWYVNEPAAGDEPNLRASADYCLIAARDIRAGEELTVRYDSFSDISQIP